MSSLFRIGKEGAAGSGGLSSFVGSDGLVIVLDRDRAAPNTPGSLEGFGLRFGDPDRNMFGNDIFSPGGRGDALGRSNWGISGTGVGCAPCVIVLDRDRLEEGPGLSYPYGL